MSDSLRPCGLQPTTRPLCPRGSPGKNTGACCHALLRGIFPTQGSNPCLMSLALAGRLFTTSATLVLGSHTQQNRRWLFIAQQLVSRFTGLCCRQQNKIGLHNRFFILTLPGVGLCVSTMFAGDPLIKLRVFPIPSIHTHIPT